METIICFILHIIRNNQNVTINVLQIHFPNLLFSAICSRMMSFVLYFLLEISFSLLHVKIARPIGAMISRDIRSASI